MKALKLTNKILSAVAASFLLLSIMSSLFGCMFSTLLESHTITAFAFTITFTFVGFALVFAKKRLAELLGYSFLGIGGAFQIVFDAACSHYDDTASTLIAIFWLLAMVTLLAAVILYVICEIKTNKPVKANNEAAVMEKLVKWKNLLDKNIITAEEFEVKKKETLAKVAEE